MHFTSIILCAVSFVVLAQAIVIPRVDDLAAVDVRLDDTVVPAAVTSDISGLNAYDDALLFKRAKTKKPKVKHDRTTSTTTSTGTTTITSTGTVTLPSTTSSFTTTYTSVFTTTRTSGAATNVKSSPGSFLIGAALVAGLITAII